MTRGLFRALGSLALLLACTAGLVALSCLLFGSFLISYPALRKSPRERRLRASADLAAAGLQLLQTFTPPAVIAARLHDQAAELEEAPEVPDAD